MGRCAAPAALEAPVHEHRVFSAALAPADSPEAPHSSAERGELRLHPCTMQTKVLYAEKDDIWEERWIKTTTPAKKMNTSDSVLHKFTPFNIFNLVTN